MSQRGPKGTKKLENVVNQPKLGPYVDAKKVRSSSLDTSGKRRRKSTGEKEDSFQKPRKKIPQVGSIEKPAMITIPQDTDMLQAIMNMEERLKISMKENRKKELDELEERMKTNMKQIVNTSIGDALSGINATVSSLIASDVTVVRHTNNIHRLEVENKKLSRAVQILAAEQTKLKEKLDHIERRNLDHCMIIRGIQEQYKETDVMLRERIFAEISCTVVGSNYNERVYMAKKMAIRSCKRLGRYNRDRARPISCEFLHPEDVSYIIENRVYLNKGIFVDHEYPPEIERKRRILLPILRAARKHPDYRDNCKLENDELVINGRHFKTSTLNQLPDAFDPFNITSEEDIDSVGFFGAINPLSNFHESAFTVNDEHYISTEQFIQSEKARFFNDSLTYDKVMGCKNSLDCKNEARYIKNYNRAKWETVAKDRCRPGLRAKFEQNPELMDVLINKTGHKTIVECARDNFWGTGVPLNDPDCLNTTKWVNPGVLGEILEEIRDEYHSSRNMLNSVRPNPSVSLQSQRPLPDQLEVSLNGNNNLPRPSMSLDRSDESTMETEQTLDTDVTPGPDRQENPDEDLRPPVTTATTLATTTTDVTSFDVNASRACLSPRDTPDINMETMVSSPSLLIPPGANAAPAPTVELQDEITPPTNGSSKEAASICSTNSAELIITVPERKKTNIVP